MGLKCRNDYVDRCPIRQGNGGAIYKEDLDHVLGLTAASSGLVNGRKFKEKEFACLEFARILFDN